MKKLVFFLALILLALGANAQNNMNGETLQLSGEEVITNPDGQVCVEAFW